MFKRIVGLGAVVGIVMAVGCGGCGGGSNGGGGTGAGGTIGTGGSSGSVHFDCCINDSHFVCPSQSALDQCSDFENPDPSACTPVSSSCGGSTSSSSGSGTGTGTSSGGSTGDLGNQCTDNSDCQYDSCLIAQGADFGYCTKTCMSFTDCPTFWSCDNVGNATGTYCVQN